MFKDSSPFTNVQAVSIHILVHEARLLALTFVLLPFHLFLQTIKNSNNRPENL